MSKKLILIDGHALAYRAFYALPLEGFTTRQGEPTNAVYGFISTLLNILQQLQPDYIAVCFDAGQSGRDEIYPDYKGHREKMPDEMQVQMPRIRQAVEAFDMPIYELDGAEADDLLGTLALQATAKKIETVIVTGDRDLLQLVTPRVGVFLSGRRIAEGKVYDEDAVRARYGGLTPSQIIDYKALVGDTSDNIPGVSGVGDKTATKLLLEYESLDSIYEHLDEIESKRFRNALEKGREMAFLSRELVTIKTDMPVDLDLEASALRNYDRSRVLSLFQELEFRSLVDRLPGGPAATGHQLPLFASEESDQRPSSTKAHVVTDEEQLADLVDRLSSAAAISFDTETTSTDAAQAKLVGIALTDREEEGWYIPVGHALGDQLPMTEVLEAVRPLFEDPDLPKYAHNAKYDVDVLGRQGVAVAGLAFDTMIAEWLTDPASRNLGLKNLAFSRLGIEMTPIQDLIGSGRNQITMAEVPIESAAPYAAADVDMTHRLVKKLQPELEQKGHWDLFKSIEIPLIDVLLAMETTGVALDVSFLTKMSAGLENQLQELEAEIQSLVGYEFNINSSQQLGEALFDKLEIPTGGVRRTPSGRYSVDATVLESLRKQHPVVELILKQRELTKLKSTYVDALPAIVNPTTGRVHTSYNQTGTVTGRISSSSPNLQNIPIRSPLGRQVRQAFIPTPGWLLLAADYSQVELRILAHISNDAGLTSAFQRGEDIHATTAAAVFDIPLDQVTKNQRRFAKTINFGLLYGMSAFRLARETDLTQAEAENFIAQYFGRFPKVREYIDNTIGQATNQGYVETLLGRRRYFPVLQSTAPGQVRAQRRAEREAINTPIQGSAADIIKQASLDLFRTLREHDLESRMIIQVHDELVLEVPRDELDTAAPLVRRVMETAYPLTVPLRVDLSVGTNWYNLEPLPTPSGD